VETINELLALSNIPVTITVEQNDRLMASKNGSEPYRAAELSDGERNALLIGAEVLTTKPGTLLLLDDPEKTPTSLNHLAASVASVSTSTRLRICHRDTRSNAARRQS
jgi:predicted ATPase